MADGVGALGQEVVSCLGFFFKNVYPYPLGADSKPALGASELSPS